MQPDRNFDRELRDLAPHIEHPPTPDLAGSVRDRLESEGGTTGRSTPAGPNLWWVAAAALVVLVAVPAFGLAVTIAGNGLLGGMSAGGVAAGGGGQGGGEEVSRVLEEEEVGGPTAASGGGLAASGGEGGGGAQGGAASAGSGASAGSCVLLEPVLNLKPSGGTPGDVFRVRGEYFDSNPTDCDDDPARDVRVEFSQGGRTWNLGEFESDANSRLAARLRVPVGARAGRATVRAAYGQGPPDDPYGRRSAEARFFVTD